MWTRLGLTPVSDEVISGAVGKRNERAPAASRALVFSLLPLFGAERLKAVIALGLVAVFTTYGSVWYGASTIWYVVMGKREKEGYHSLDIDHI